MVDSLLNAPWWAWLIVGLLVGFIFGSFVLDKKKTDGIIHVSKDGSKYLFEFNIPPEKIPEMKQVVFGVEIKDNAQEIQSP